jgi:hypothetical protein
LQRAARTVQLVRGLHLLAVEGPDGSAHRCGVRGGAGSPVGRPVEQQELYWGSVRETIEEAGYAGSSAAVDYLNRNAGYTRAGRGGTANMRWVDAHDWTVATFFQHTSRANDPQLHYHNPILLATRDAVGRGAQARHGACCVSTGRALRRMVLGWSQELVTEKLGWTLRGAHGR